jgi:acetyl/propionyl-CoA carboxylase alpha subunit
VETGSEVGLHYDALLAKLIVHGADRMSAIHRMQRALRELLVVGVATNQAFLLRLLADPAFCRGEVDIQFLERREDLFAPLPDAARELRIVVAAALAEDELRQRRTPEVGNQDPAAGAWTGAGRRDALR